jgi:hypothetical protein
MWGLWWTKRNWGRFSPSTSVFPANHTTKFSTIIITRGWHNRSISGRSAEWIQLDSQLKKKISESVIYDGCFRHKMYPHPSLAVTLTDLWLCFKSSTIRRLLASCIREASVQNFRYHKPAGLAAFISSSLRIGHNRFYWNLLLPISHELIVIILRIKSIFKW